MNKSKKTTKSHNVVTSKYLDTRLEKMTDYLDMRLNEFKEEIREDLKEGTVKILQIVDKFITRFDAEEKDRAAHTVLHQRISDTADNHDMRLKKIEARS